MSDAAVILDELRELRRLVEALLPPPLDRRQQELLDALEAVFGASPFSASEVLELARTPTAERRRVRAAIEALGVADAQRLGMALAAIAKRTTGRRTRLARCGSERGSSLWGIDAT